MYGYYVGRYLKDNPTPTKLDIQSYLAQRLGGGTITGRGGEHEEGVPLAVQLPLRGGAVGRRPDAENPQG